MNGPVDVNFVVIEEDAILTEGKTEGGHARCEGALNLITAPQ